MNFLGLRSQQTAAQQPEVHAESNITKQAAASLEALTDEDPFPVKSLANGHDRKSEVAGSKIGRYGCLSVNNGTPVVNKHIDVREEEGWITIPREELPDSWSEKPDMLSFRSLDRPFVFPGEQVHILASLSAYKQDTEIITPFKVAELMIKIGIGQNTKKQNGKVEHVDQNGNIDPKKDALAGESLLKMEDHERQTQMLLQRFRNSHFFARIAEADDPLWSKRKTHETFRESIEMIGGKLISDEAESCMDGSVDKGSLDASTSGGVARNGFKCCTLANGDIVVLLQLNIGVDFLKNPILEILQFEKLQDQTLTSGITSQDPCGDLLNWLLPLENSLLPPPRSVSSIRSSSTKPNLPGSSGSEVFSLNNFRSYSMSSVPPNSIHPPSFSPSDDTPSFDLEDWDQFSSRKLGICEKVNSEELLSFRGVPLEPERYSVRCGLEGIYTPGRRWRRKIEIIQPLQIHSFAADCNTEDLLCVQIKNVSPAHVPDIVLYLDTISVIYQEASKGGPPSSLQFTCIEAGNDHSLPDLALRRGEEHSFILKPATSLWWSGKGQGDKSSRSSGPSNIDHSALCTDTFAVLVSCRCNYTESRLFFKQPTSWRPRISRDILISVSSQMPKQTLGSDDKVSRLPVQVLTLQASNLTSENLTLSVLAPTSFTSPSSLVSLNSSSVSSASTALENHRSSDDNGSQDKTIARSDLGCTHLWLQSRVPLGCVRSRSTATIKLELLPLTDGILTLDSLQIDVKEKGLTYIPEHSLKINTTSSISTGII